MPPNAPKELIATLAITPAEQEARAGVGGPSNPAVLERPFFSELRSLAQVKALETPWPFLSSWIAQGPRNGELAAPALGKN